MPSKGASRAPTQPITARQLFEAHRWFTLDELAHLPGNPNQGDPDSLTASLDEFGWMDGVVVADGVLIAGNHRLDQALAKGEEGLPGYDLTPYVGDDRRRMAMAIAHNRTTRLGQDDPQALTQAIKPLDPSLLKATSITALQALEWRTTPLEAQPSPVDVEEEWARMGMPTHDQRDVEEYKAVVIHFATEEDWLSFCDVAGTPPTWSRRYVWFPHKPEEQYRNYRYQDPTS